MAMTTETLEQVLAVLRREIRKWKLPILDSQYNARIPGTFGEPRRTSDGALGHRNAWIHHQTVLVEPLKNIKGPPPIGEGPLLVLNGSGERI